MSTSAPLIIDSTFNEKSVLAYLRKRDPTLKALFKKIGAYEPSWQRDQIGTNPSPYDWLFRSIIYQQLHGKAASTIHGRVRDLFGKSKITPQAFLAMDQEKLRGAGLSGNKLAGLRDLSRAAIAGEVPTSRRARLMSDEELVEHLLPIRGIGRWTVEMFLMFGLKRADILAVDDFALKKSTMLLYELPAMPNKKIFTEIAEPWRPWRSVVCWYLWRALD